VIDQASRTLLGNEQYSKLNHTKDMNFGWICKAMDGTCFFLCLVIQYCGDICCTFWLCYRSSKLPNLNKCAVSMFVEICFTQITERFAF